MATLGEMNAGARLWFKVRGLNVFPGVSTEKATYEDWDAYHNKPIPDEMFEKWIKEGKFLSGISVSPGYVYRIPELQGWKAVCFDWDRIEGFNALYPGKTVEQVAQNEYIEWHDDDKTRGHLWAYVPIVFPKKEPDLILGIEVKGLNEHGVMVSWPSTHKNGHQHKPVGTDQIKVWNKEKAEAFLDHLIKVCKDNDIDYPKKREYHNVNDNNNSGTKEKANSNNSTALLKSKISKMLKSWPIKIDDKMVIEEGLRHEILLFAANSLLFRYSTTKNQDKLHDIFNQINYNLCKPDPSPNQEVEQIWKDALGFVKANVGNAGVASEYVNDKKATDESEDKNKDKEEDVKRHYEAVQMYKDQDYHAEAVIIGNMQRLAVVDFNKGGVIELKPTLEIPQNDSDSIIDVYTAFDKTSYINKPYVFVSDEQFNATVELARQYTLDSLYEISKKIWSKYIDADDYHLSICAADTVFTYFQDIIGMTHYLFFVGDNDSGKSNNLVTLHYLGYRNLMSIGMSSANVYSFLGSTFEGVGTISEDEANYIDQDNDKMDIAKSGYTTGYPVLKITITPMGRYQRRYFTFCFKAYSAEKTPDPVRGKGLIQRVVVLRCIAGNPQYDILEVANPAGDENFDKLLEELHQFRNLLLCYRLIHIRDQLPNIKINLKNRESQLFKPVLKLFQGTKTFDELCDVISHYVNQRRKTKKHTIHAFLCQLVDDMIEDAAYENLRIRMDDKIGFETGEIWTIFKARTNSREIPGKPMSVETEEFGTVSHRQITGIFKDILKAEYGVSNSERKLYFNLSDVKNVLTTYSDAEVKIEKSPNISSTVSTDSTDLGGVPTGSTEETDAENTDNEDENATDFENPDSESEKSEEHDTR